MNLSKEYLQADELEPQNLQDIQIPIRILLHGAGLFLALIPQELRELIAEQAIKEMLEDVQRDFGSLGLLVTTMTPITDSNELSVEVMASLDQLLGAVRDVQAERNAS